MSQGLDFDIGKRRLRVVSVTSSGEVDLAEFKSGDERLVMVMRAEEHSDGLAYTCFRMALGDRGLLSYVRGDDLAALASDLAMPADVAARWLAESNVTVAALGIPAELVAAAVLAADTTVGQAVDAVRRLMPDALVTPDEEITVSVAKDHMVLRRDLRRRRLEHVARGGSPWDIR